MNSYPMTATCALCGGLGAASPQVAAAEWDKDAAETIFHIDPRVCKVVLDAKVEQAKRV